MICTITILKSFLELHIPRADVRIYIKSSLGVDRDPRSRSFDSVTAQICVNDILLVLQLPQDLGIRTGDKTMTPSVVGGRHVPGGTAHGHVDLVVHGSRASEQRPVEGTSGQVEGAWIYKQERAFACGNHGGLGESDVVADGKPDLAILRQVNDGDLVPGRQHLALLESNLARDVDVKQVCLAMASDQRSGGREHERCVVVFLRGGLDFRDAASNQV